MMQRMAVVLGGSLIGADSLLAKNINWDNMEYGPEGAGCKGIGLFSKSQIKLMNEIAETIIPTTSTPGAIAHVSRNKQCAFLTDLHTGDAFIPSANDLPLAETENKRAATIDRRIKFLAFFASGV